MFIETKLMTDKQRREAGDISGKIITWLLEGRSIKYMADSFGQTPGQVHHNMCEMLYELKRAVGIRTYLKILFHK